MFLIYQLINGLWKYQELQRWQEITGLGILDKEFEIYIPMLRWRVGKCTELIVARPSSSFAMHHKLDNIPQEFKSLLCQPLITNGFVEYEVFKKKGNHIYSRNCIRVHLSGMQRVNSQQPFNHLQMTFQEIWQEVGTDAWALMQCIGVLYFLPTPSPHKKFISNTHSCECCWVYPHFFPKTMIVYCCYLALEW